MNKVLMKLVSVELKIFPIEKMWLILIKTYFKNTCVLAVIQKNMWTSNMFYRDFIEVEILKVFDSSRLRWANRLTIS